MSTALSVFGLGYVGCVSSACFAKEGHRVIGVDVSRTKVDMINSGRATIVESGIGELVAEMVASGRLSATTDAAAAVEQSDLSLVCVGTPSRSNGSIDLRYVERVCQEIGAAIKNKAARHTVVIRSTVLPGSVQRVVIPALESASGKQAGRDFGVCMNPEFLREGTSIRDFYEPPFTLIGTDDRSTADAVAGLYAGLEAPVHVTSTGVAEMIKYTCNCFHGLKVGFANEVGNICKVFGVDSHEVMRIFCLDTKLNLSPAYLRPGFAFGGSCLPKDLRAITHHARVNDVATPILSATLDSNQRQIERAYEMVRAAGSRNVGVLGLAFKAGTDDLRESPMVSVVEMLIGKGANLAIYDRDVSEARLIGSNREYIEHEIPHIWSLMRGSVDEVIDASEVIVIGNGSGEFRLIEPKLRQGQVVIDLVRAFGDRTSNGDGYRGICW
ncbi:MAG TPA: UDP-glucose/GDP-mannose dehydrogenase family protein [Gemmatimonadaceae bacterium]|jgi:GDP-mannose 6-dehydrogenase|nr:UDP-glucose/GDP-mannose dehydrogenase family protein [Gemmatimonadaceae bacterium]